MPKYSVIVPVYNRPHEVEELLMSLVQQSFKDFEVVLVEDGSTITCKDVYERYAQKLSIKYFFKPNSGPGPSRNFGFNQATGSWLVVFDSDCVLPPGYFDAVEKYQQRASLDVWGGPDKGRSDFTLLQQAMGYSMASTLTTGGIRGGKQKGFQPRSYNMGMSRIVFGKTGGFVFDRFAEDIEFSIRARKLGFKVGLIPDAFVYHKRRTTLPGFFRQVANFGKGRVLVGRTHPGEVKLTHWFPALFLAGLFLIPILLAANVYLGLIATATYTVYLLAIGLAGIAVTGNVAVGVLAIPAALVQLTGYGYGFLKEKLRG